MPELSIKDKMISEALLIIHTVEFIGKRIESLMLELEEAVVNKEFERIQQIEYEFMSCKHKINQEDENVNKFMSKYRKIIKDEKESILHDIVEKKQIHLRSLSEDKPREKRCKKIQGKINKRKL